MSQADLQKLRSLARGCADLVAATLYSVAGAAIGIAEGVWRHAADAVPASYKNTLQSIIKVTHAEGLKAGYEKTVSEASKGLDAAEVKANGTMNGLASNAAPPKSAEKRLDNGIKGSG